MTRELKEDIGITVPTGSILPYAGEAIPDGYILCDGTVFNTEVDITLVSLYAVIGNAWGGVDNTDFRVPDLRGEFLRGVDSMGVGPAGNDPNSAPPTPIACTFTDSNNYVTATHGLPPSARVMFLSIDTTTGIEINTPYWAYWPSNIFNPNFFQLTLEGPQEGTPIDLVTNGSGTFINITDYRVRKYDGGNEGDNVGSFQYDEFESHVHSKFDFGGSAHEGGNDVQQGGTLTGNYPNIPGDGNETRPRNANVNFIIKK